jgi:hypothetical protein
MIAVIPPNQVIDIVLPSFGMGELVRHRHKERVSNAVVLIEAAYYHMGVFTPRNGYKAIIFRMRLIGRYIFG